MVASSASELPSAVAIVAVLTLEWLIALLASSVLRRVSSAQLSCALTPPSAGGVAPQTLPSALLPSITWPLRGASLRAFSCQFSIAVYLPLSYFLQPIRLSLVA